MSDSYVHGARDLLLPAGETTTSGDPRVRTRSEGRSRFRVIAGVAGYVPLLSWASILDRNAETRARTPFDQVMADAASLVPVWHTLRQVVSVKGD